MFSINYKFVLLIVLLLTGFSACDVPTTSGSTMSIVQQEEKTPPVKQQSPVIIDKSRDFSYTWLDNFEPKDALLNRIATPSNYKRTPVRKESFANWLRHLPLKPDGTAVYYYNGSKKPNQRVQHSVIDIDTGKRDLQQCADAVMRLKAEYHYGLKAYKDIHFNYTNGALVSFDDWRYGRKPVINSSNNSTFTDRKTQCDNSYKNFKRYMTSIFSYAGTHSLSKEMEQIELKDMQLGDVFIQGGFPGHAVIIVDMAIHEKTGEQLFMLAQSYMPAQDMHILVNPNDARLSPWYSTDFGDVLQTPEWTFKRGDLKRF